MKEKRPSKITNAKPKKQRQKMSEAIIIALISLVGVIITAILSSPYIKDLVALSRSPTVTPANTIDLNINIAPTSVPLGTTQPWNLSIDHGNCPPIGQTCRLEVRIHWVPVSGSNNLCIFVSPGRLYFLQSSISYTGTDTYLSQIYIGDETTALGAVYNVYAVETPATCDTSSSLPSSAQLSSFVISR